MILLWEQFADLRVRFALLLTVTVLTVTPCAFGVVWRVRAAFTE